LSPFHSGTNVIAGWPFGPDAIVTNTESSSGMVAANAA
jgi:hypothetical protein